MRLGSILMLFSFINVQIFATFVGWMLIASQAPLLVENPADVGNSVSFLAYIIGSAIGILLLLKVYKGKLLFFGMELGLLFITGWTFFSLFIPEPYELMLAIALVGLRIGFKQHRNSFLLFSSSVVGALLGASLDLLPAALFAILLSAYDYAAVFMTKHMIDLAEGLRDRGAAFSISFPARKLPAGTVMASEGKKQPKGTKEVKLEGIELGTGDLVIPAMLTVAALKISPFHAVAAGIGAFVGIAGLFYYIDKRKGYWPALPPIVFGSLFVLAIYWGLTLLFH